METFFGRVRCRLGCNTNPTAIQFTAAYKKLVLGANGRNFSISANVIGQDNTHSLDVFTSKKSGIQYLEKEYELEDELEDELDSLDPYLSEFKQSSIVYIAGFVKRKLQTKVKCMPCLEVVGSISNLNFNNSLTHLKDKGGLLYPSEDLIKVCQVTESKIENLKTNEQLFNDGKILHRICLKTTSTIITQYPGVFKAADHEAMHRYNLLKEASLIFAILRLKHLAKEKNREEKQTKIRRKLSKLVIFSHQ